MTQKTGIKTTSTMAANVLYISTAALRWVIVIGVLVALYFFGIVSSAF